MNPLTLKVHPDAIREVRSARQWYAVQSSRVASGFMEELQNGVRQILDAPLRWPAHLLDTRKFRLSRYPYHIIYQPGSHVIQIVAVAHAHRRPGYWKERITS